MSGTVNKVILIGCLTRDPEVRNFQNGGKVCNLSLATNEMWRDKNTGERRDRAEFHSVAIYADTLVNLAEQYLRKGSKVYVEGQLETRKWQDQSGADRYTTEIALRPFRGELMLLDGKPDSHNSDGHRDGPRQQSSGHVAAGIGAYDDEIPF